MRKIRWIDYARRSMQRLGYLKLLVVLAQKLGPTTLEGLTARFENVVTSSREVPPDLRHQVLEYVREQKLHRRYGKDIVEASIKSVEFQDLYLSDPELPSSSGAITGEMDVKGYRHAVYVEIPPWAVQLGLIRRQNYSVTDRGKALLSLSPDAQASLDSFDPRTNPFRLSVPQRFFLTFSMIEADGDLLRHAYALLTSERWTFTRSHLGAKIADALIRISKEQLNVPSTGKELQLRRKMQEVVESVRNHTGPSMGPTESVATPRTEPLVDCGLLIKVARNTYSYEIPERNRTFFEGLIESEGVEEFLERSLARSFSATLGISVRTFDSSEVLSRVARAYKRLRSGLGYCSLREVAVLAVAESLAERVAGFEIRDAEQAVMEAARKYGRSVRLAQSRSGSLPQLRIDPTLVDSLVGQDSRNG